MKVIRRNVFESNSSSCHSIAISKDKVPNVAGKHVYFGAGEYGWEQDCVEDTASYLHTAIVDSSTPAQYEERINKIKEILDRYGVQYEFAPVKYKKSEYNPDYEYIEFASPNSQWAHVDHAYECAELINTLLSNEDLLIRYLFGDSCIYTGNDNSGDEDDMCYCAVETIYDWNTREIRPNPNHDAEHYDYFFKGN